MNRIERTSVVAPWCRAAGIALAILVGACGPIPAGDDPVSASRQDLLAGTPTTARPEIGRFSFASGQWTCAGTLITPTTVLTFASCFGYTEVPPGGMAFQFNDRAGTPRIYGVDAVKSLPLVISSTNGGNTNKSTLPDGVGVNEVALVTLSQAVPADQATPAIIASAPPTIGQMVTAFGYGCTSPHGSGGTKTFLTYPFGGSTNIICIDAVGDGGGPRVFGGVNDNGAIWAMDGGLAGFGDSGLHDLLGGVSYFKEEILSEIRYSSGSPFDEGIDRFGSDLTDFEMSTSGPEACQSACVQNNACRAFSNLGTHCWLKKDSGDWRPAPGFRSGLRPALEVGFDRSGQDFTYFALTEPRPEICRAACARDSRCQAFTATAPGAPGTPGCWLKSGVPALTANSGFVSGLRQATPAVDHYGYDYADFDVNSTTLSCETRCARDTSCRAFTLGPITSGTTRHCWLKRSAAAASSSTTLSSAVRAGLEVETDRFGADLRDFDISNDDGVAEYCQTACAQDDACQSWSFAPAGVVFYDRAHCWLKSGVPAPSFRADFISGVKGTEFLGP
jgi:hypothetical protein